MDLDSVYKNDKGELIYWLDKVEVNVRNMWNLVIVLEFNDGSLRHFQSRSFRLRTKPRNYKNRSQSGNLITLREAVYCCNLFDTLRTMSQTSQNQTPVKHSLGILEN